MNIIKSTKRTDCNVSGVMSCFILPQNGVVEGPMHYGSGGPSAQIGVGSTLDSHNGNVGSGDTPKRPKNLEVNSTNGYATKSCREDSDLDDSSLPCTPDLHSDIEITVSSCPEEYEVLENDTRQLINSFLMDFTGRPKSRLTETKAQLTMKRVVQGVLEKHKYTFNGMIQKLSLDKREDDVRFIGAVARSLFADGTANWGRIVSLVAFGGVVCQYLREKKRENCVEQVGQEISSYLLSDQRDWLVKNNSWDGFVEFFRVSDPESTVRNTLMAFAGFAGIGATLALLIRLCLLVSNYITNPWHRGCLYASTRPKQEGMAAFFHVMQS
ncbi:induced myeloid leukemia cell differentiation protein Mcl-1b isoform X3 [Xiphias gladius]|uniref:induced myeloid leukemia cell differentiation protein Mcl-1b isoform X3 n=1 Tax=Xiphias gladius TaxID=8245 RepID=UPI001A98FDDC|nr:induced myeloid leukemia cell differentiation protein Mcl-1b isoform X3 [Xiphias gladius]